MVLQTGPLRRRRGALTIRAGDGDRVEAGGRGDTAGGRLRTEMWLFLLSAHTHTHTNEAYVEEPFTDRDDSCGFLFSNGVLHSYF